MKNKNIDKIKKLESLPKIVKIFSNKEIKDISDLYNALPVTTHNKKQNIIKKRWLQNYNKSLDKIYISKIQEVLDDFKNKPSEEIQLINQIKSHLSKDSRNKMVITNYPFLSPILDEKSFAPSRVYTGDGTTIPIKESKYKTQYKKLMINLIKKNKISVVYIVAPLDRTIIYNYIDQQCFEENYVLEQLKSYEIKNCIDING